MGTCQSERDRSVGLRKGEAPCELGTKKSASQKMLAKRKTQLKMHAKYTLEMKNGRAKKKYFSQHPQGLNTPTSCILM